MSSALVRYDPEFTKGLGMINKINIDLTTVCNAKCPFCMRMYLKHFTNKPVNFLNINKFTNLDWESIPNLYCLVFCGAMGEPTMYPDLIQLINFIHNNLNVKIIIHTNGMPHNEKWWKELGKLMSNNDSITFAIDGLTKKTHEIYRVNTNLNKIKQNIKAFVNAGGNGKMSFLTFKHNEHEIPNIPGFVKSLGLKKYLIRPSRSYNDILKKPIMEFSKTNNIVYCYPEQGEIALDVYGKVHLCCFSVSKRYFVETGIKKLPPLKYFNTFKELQKSIYWKYLKELKFCRKCNENRYRIDNKM